MGPSAVLGEPVTTSLAAVTPHRFDSISPATCTCPTTDSSIPSSRRAGAAPIHSKTTVPVKQGSARIDLPCNGRLARSAGLGLAARVIGLARFARDIPHLLSAHMAAAGACGQAGMERKESAHAR